MYQQIEKAFGSAAYTVKGGEVVVKDGEVVAVPNGTTFWVDAKIPDSVEEDLMRGLREDFGKYYTVSLRNYPVEDAYLPQHRPISPEGGRKW
jgi:formylmethanofuran dehydrogenase subunit A